MTEDVQVNKRKVEGSFTLPNPQSHHNLAHLESDRASTQGLMQKLQRHGLLGTGMRVRKTKPIVVQRQGRYVAPMGSEPHKKQLICMI